MFSRIVQSEVCATWPTAKDVGLLSFGTPGPVEKYDAFAASIAIFGGHVAEAVSIAKLTEAPPDATSLRNFSQTK